MSYYHPNRHIVQDMKRYPPIMKLGPQVAASAVPIAKAFAATLAFDTGDYMRGIGMEVDIDGDGWTVGKLVGRDWKSGLIEFGSSKREATPVLSLTLQSMGYYVGSND